MTVSASTLKLCADPDLQRDPATTVDLCAEKFLALGGTIQSVSWAKGTTSSETWESKIMESLLCDSGTIHEVPCTSGQRPVKLPRGASIYPICSGGSCRSQTVWAHLKKNFEKQLTLFPPHSANHGWDPYNGRTNRDRSKGETVEETRGFPEHFGMEKSQRAGFENNDEWKKTEANPTPEGLAAIKEYYNSHYFGPTSAERRIYITFEKNAHIIMHRLNETNSSLKSVTVVAINMNDLISRPDKEGIIRRSASAYANFERLVTTVLDTTELVS